MSNYSSSSMYEEEPHLFLRLFLTYGYGKPVIYLYKKKTNRILFFKRKYYCKKEGNALCVCDIQNHMVKSRTEDLTSRGLVKFLMPYI